MKRKIALIIMDGFGLSSSSKGNAIKLAGTPNLDRLKNEYPHTQIEASGLDVGLPAGQIGNSEVGHLNMGAGQIIYQDITRIDKSISDGDFFQNPAFISAIDSAKKNGGALHLGGLLSDGGVHSNIEHLFALIRLAKARGLSRVFIHCFMDGRDVSPTSGIKYIQALENFCSSEGVGKIASVGGRFYIMDRDNRWERVEQGFNCMTAGLGLHETDAQEAVKSQYNQGKTDEFIIPFAIVDENQRYIGEFKDGDSFINFNFRADRARELSRAILEKDFSEFKRAKGYLKLNYVSLTQYDEKFQGVSVAFAPKKICNTFGEVIAKNGLRQLRIAETEKYAHVTFFFNGGVEAPNCGEERILIASPKVATYDLAPKMSAEGVLNAALRAIESDAFDVLIINFANCDMVGHTGVIDATIEAVKTTDECVGILTDAMIKCGGAAYIVSDHGNAEQMLAEDGSPWTAHSTNPVPFIVADPLNKNVDLSRVKRLADVVHIIYELNKEMFIK